jgi:tetratricopeptide (TPR) repeat protein
VARFKMNDYDWAGAEQAFRRTLELEPGHATARRQYALLLAILGRRDEALALIQRMKESDPLNIHAYRYAGLVYYFSGQMDRAIEEYRAALLLDNKDVFVHLDLGMTYAASGMYAESIQSWERTFAIAGRDPRLLSLLAYSLAKHGRTAEARRVQREVEEAARRVHISPFSFALIHYGFGEADRAFERLEEAYRERNPYLYYLASPLFDSIRSDPRLQDLLRRMNLPSGASP